MGLAITMIIRRSFQTRDIYISAMIMPADMSAITATEAPTMTFYLTRSRLHLVNLISWRQSIMARPARMLMEFSLIRGQNRWRHSQTATILGGVGAGAYA